VRAGRLAATLSIACLLLAACAPGNATPSPAEVQQPELLVGAASSLEPLFRELGVAFEEETGAKVTFVFGASGNLSRQIEEGAPLDVFASADVSFVERLQNNGLVQSDRYSNFAEGQLVAITSLSIPPETSWQELATDNRVRFISIANPEVAPYGHQAKTALTEAGLWEHLQPRLVFGETVAQVFQFVASGNADVGFTAQSLVMQAVPSSVTVIPVSPCDHGGLPQTIVGISTTHQWEMTERFVNFVGEWATPEVLARHGYGMPLGKFGAKVCP
jgi:molybdate transport system substrate-binding protein